MICELCKERPAEHKHHLFSQSKWARKLYGKLIDHKSNIMLLCSVCHLNKPIPKHSEIVFCERLGIKPKSKINKKNI
jgi:5-methylcytosine-specific restriction endonuclease McrA